MSYGIVCALRAEDITKLNQHKNRRFKLNTTFKKFKSRTFFASKSVLLFVDLDPLRDHVMNTRHLFKIPWLIFNYGKFCTVILSLEMI